MKRHLTGLPTALACAAICVAGGLATLSGCKQADRGPKHADYQVAHTAHYHPDVHRDASGHATSQPASTTQPTDFRFGGGPLGSPILFVNAQAITVPQVLEPLYDDLCKNACTLSEGSYRNYLIQEVARQINDEISAVIIFQEAKKTFPDKADEAFGKEADKWITDVINNQYGGVYARYEEHLQAVGITSTEMKERTKRRMMIAQYLHEHFKPLLREPTRAELMKYYAEHKADFTTAARAEMFIIEVPVSAVLKKTPSAATSAELAGARMDALAQIRRAREELESGVDFGTVARQYSQGLQAVRGGAVGEVSPGSMTGRYVPACIALFALEEGQVSQPIETPEAAMLIKCGRKTPEHQGTFEECQNQIRAQLMKDQFQELQRNYILAMEAKSVIGQRDEFMLAVLSAAPRPPQYATGARPASAP